MAGIAARRARLWTALAALLLVVDPAWAQDYPTKPIRMVVGFAAGGGNDLLARIVAPKLSEQLGQPVIVENRTGAGGRLAIEYVQSQPADGHAIAIGAIGQLAVATAIYPNLPFHPTRSLIPVSMLASYPLVVSGPANDAIKSLPDLVAFAKADPAKANYPSSSPIFTISSELLKMKTGMPGQMIPYRSTNEMLLSVVGGQTLFAVADSAVTVPLAQSGKVRALAVAGPSRIPELPEVPTMAEVGLADIDIKPQWSGAFVVAGTPPVIVRRLEAELRRAVADPAVRERIRAMAYYPEGGSGDEFRRRIDFDIQVFADAVKAANLKFDQ